MKFPSPAFGENMIIDGKNAVLGRLASVTAKNLLKGEEVVILNAEKIIITGNPKQIKEKYLERRRIGSPKHGPFFPNKPELILYRTIRGMLPYKMKKGKDALRRLKIHLDFPKEFEGKAITFTKEIKTDFITLGELAKILGWKR